MVAEELNIDKETAQQIIIKNIKHSKSPHQASWRKSKNILTS
jgi:hypothetical protein